MTSRALRPPGRLGTSALVGLAVVLGLGSRAPSQTAPAKVLTDKEAADFAAAVEQAVLKADADGFRALVDWDAVIDRATADFDAPQKFRDQFHAEARAGFLKSRMANNIIETLQKGGSFRLLRVRTRDGKKTALFRLAKPDAAGMNYMEFLPGRRPDGRVRAVDLYILFSGEWLSQAIRRRYLDLVARERGLTGAAAEQASGLPQMARVLELAKAGKNKEALAVWDEMPPAAQKEKTALLVRVAIAQKVDEATYADAIERYRTQLPDDATADFVSIDGLIVMKKYDQALEAADRLDKAVGGDPYIGVVRVGIDIKAGQPEKAREVGRKTVASMPDMIVGYQSVLTAGLALKDYRDALATLKTIREKFRLEFKDMTTVPEYAGFVQSPQYQEWLDHLQGGAAKGAKEPEAAK